MALSETNLSSVKLQSLERKQKGGFGECALVPSFGAQEDQKSESSSARIALQGTTFGGNFGTGKHLPKPPFWRPPFCESPNLGCGVALSSQSKWEKYLQGSEKLGLAPKLLQNFGVLCGRVLQQGFYYANPLPAFFLPNKSMLQNRETLAEQMATLRDVSNFKLFF